MTSDRRYDPSRRTFLAGLASLSISLGVDGQQLSSAPKQPAPAQDPFPNKKKVLAIGDVHTGYQHDSVSHALATIEQLGRQSGDFITYIRTDTQLITKGDIYGTGRYSAPPTGTRRINAKNLNYFEPSFSSDLAKRSSPLSRGPTCSLSSMTMGKVSSARTPQ